jgi:glutathione S-transferase
MNKEAAVPRLEIFGSERSSYTRVVRMACEEKGIDYDLIDTPLGAPELRNIHPFGKMPVMRHGDFTLCESKAIATYLDRSFGGPELIPADPRLAGQVEQWISLVNTTIDPLLVRTYLFSYIVPKGADGKPDRGAIETMMPRVREQLSLLERTVAASCYLAGERFTLADINLLPMMFYISRMPETAESFAAGTALRRYYDTHAARPSFVRTVPPLSPPRRVVAG